MYGLSAYGRMIGDSVRCRAYADALEAAIRPGCVVLEIGAGPGLFALHAARLGARKVYAVEPNEAIQVARELAVVNGLSDRIDFYQGLSTELVFPEPADVIVSDLRGVMPLFRNHLPSIIDARERLLAPGGILIPRQDSLWVSVVTAEKIYRDLTLGWRDNVLDVDLSAPLNMVKNTVIRADIESAQCLVEPRRWATIDYRTVKHQGFGARLDWEISSGGLAHGLALWFDTMLTAESGYSNAPGQPELIYGKLFLPFLAPVELEARERLTVDLEVAPVGADYVWRWTTEVDRLHGVGTRFEQSTFHGEPFSLSNLRKQAASYLPRRNENGQIARFVLARMDGQTSLEGIARGLQQAFPARFGHWREAFTRVAELAARYG